LKNTDKGCIPNKLLKSFKVIQWKGSRISKDSKMETSILNISPTYCHFQELKNLQDQTTSSFTFGKDLISHNLVVFRNGEGALQVLPPLVDVISEAR